jgi:NAD(P)-dependent dehydrogenase (short-subunit alcohol dehydrogenase family)
MKKKNVLIFGAQGLIGRQLYLCNKLNREYNIIGLDLRNNLNKEIIKINTLNEKKLIKKLNEIHKVYGKIYASVNVTFPKVLQRNNPPKINSKVFTKEFSNHVCSFLNTTQTMCEYFIEKNIKGRIINFASIYGNFTPRFEIYKNTGMNLPLQYTVSKSSIITLTKYFSKFFLKKKININTISPGGVFDYQHKVFLRNYKKFCANGMLKNNDLNGVVQFLLSNNSKNLYGQNIVVDDGFTL